MHQAWRAEFAWIIDVAPADGISPGIEKANQTRHEAWPSTGFASKLPNLSEAIQKRHPLSSPLKKSKKLQNPKLFGLWMPYTSNHSLCPSSFMEIIPSQGSVSICRKISKGLDDAETPP